MHSVDGRSLFVATTATSFKALSVPQFTASIGKEEVKNVQKTVANVSFFCHKCKDHELQLLNVAKADKGKRKIMYFWSL